MRCQISVKILPAIRPPTTLLTSERGLYKAFAALMANKVPARHNPRNRGSTRTRSSIAQVRFTYAESMTDPKYYIPLAQAAEDGRLSTP